MNEQFGVAFGLERADIARMPFLEDQVDRLQVLSQGLFGGELLCAMLAQPDVPVAGKVGSDVRRVIALLTESLPAPAALVTSAHLVSAFGVALAANYGQVGRRHVIVKHLLRATIKRAAVLAAEHALALLVLGQVSLNCFQMV